MTHLPLSVALITFNEEDNLPRTLEAITNLASEIVVVDSHSSDRTREIAAQFGARVYDEDWKGHIAQKNSALEKCAQPWVLALDADEVVTPQLLESIRKAIDSQEADGYTINRKTVYLGKKLNFMWQPDRKLRLVKRTANPRWGGYNPHDKLLIDGKTKALRGDLMHYSYRDLRDHWQRMVGYCQTVAHSYHADGKRFSFLRLFLNPAFGVFKAYVLRGGFLDGLPGFLAAFSKGVYVFLKYAFLWEIEKKKGLR